RWSRTRKNTTSAVATAFMLARSARRNIRRWVISARAEKWTSARSALAALTPTTARKSLKNTEPIGWPRASSRCVLKCARRSHCWPATAMSSPRYTRNACPSADMGQALGDGRPLTKKRLRRNSRRRCESFRARWFGITFECRENEHAETCCAYAPDRRRIGTCIHGRNIGAGFRPAAEFGQSDRRCRERAATPAAAQGNSRSRHDSGREVLHD